MLMNLSHEYTSDAAEFLCKNDYSALSPKEAAEKIWKSWLRYRMLAIQNDFCYPDQASNAFDTTISIFNVSESF